MRDSLEGIKKGKNVKGKAKTAETITAKTERILDRRTDNVMTFEQMGVDALFIDEAHNYKKIGFPSKMSNVKGIDTSASQRANSMLLKPNGYLRIMVVETWFWQPVPLSLIQWQRSGL